MYGLVLYMISASAFLYLIFKYFLCNTKGVVVMSKRFLPDSDILFSTKGEELGHILDVVQGRPDGTVMLSDILYAMTMINPVLKAYEVGELILAKCPEGVIRKMEPYKDEYLGCLINGPDIQMKDAYGFKELIEAFNRGEQVVLNRDFIEEYLGVDANDESDNLSAIRYVIYAKESQADVKCYMTLYDKSMEEDQIKIKGGKYYDN